MKLPKCGVCALHSSNCAVYPPWRVTLSKSWESASQLEALEKGESWISQFQGSFCTWEGAVQISTGEKDSCYSFSDFIVNTHVWHEAQTSCFMSTSLGAPHFVRGQLISYKQRGKKGKKKIELHKYFHSFRVHFFSLIITMEP